MISTDRKIFEENSEVRRRMIEYGILVEELHIVIFSRKNSPGPGSGLGISENVFIYPTNSPSRWFYVFDAAKIGAKIIKNAGGDFLVSAQDSFEAGLAGYFAARRAGAPLQLQVHTDFLSPYFKKAFLLNRFRVALAKFLIPRASCVRVVSLRIKNSLAAAIRRLPPVSVLPVFVDVEKIKNAPIGENLHRKYPQFDFIVLAAGRLTKEKNIEMAIGAMRGVVRRHPKAGLVIIGSGPEQRKLERKARKANLENNIVFEGWTDLASYYKTADLFLLTSNYEGYGRTVVEAMAANCPVVMTDVGVAGEIIKDGYNGIVVPVGNAQKTEEAILKLAGDKELRLNLALSAENALACFPGKDEYLKQMKNGWENCSR